MMEAIVLAGGFGTRLREVVPDLPKPMASVAGRPFLEILLTALACKGFCRVILSVGYMSDKVISHFGGQFAGMDLIYEVEDIPLGTGGAVRQALTRCNSDHVFVFNGDTYLDLEVADVEVHWQTHHQPIIVAREEPETARYGRLNVLENRVIGFLEKGEPGAGLINAGCYVLPVAILDKFALGQVFSLETDFLANTVGVQRIDLFVTNGHFIDIGVPEDYARAQTVLADI
ncbi:MAG: nucleotidyltransferase family protein [Mucilaginibacter sp.]